MTPRPDTPPDPPMPTVAPQRSATLRWTLTVAIAVVLAAVSWFGPRLAKTYAPARLEDSPRPPPQPASVDGEAVVKMSEAAARQIGIETVAPTQGQHLQELRAYGTVLDVARITDLANSYANASAQLQTAQAKYEVSKSAYQRAKSLGQYATAVQVEAAQGAYRTDQAALAAAESQVRTLAATAQQEWGPVLGKAIVERSPAVVSLIEREQLLLQVTLSPGALLEKAPETALVEVPSRGLRVEVHFISDATRTDPRIQGMSFFYRASGDSGLLPGMSADVFLASGRAVEGMVVDESAVVRWQGRAWVYLRIGPETYKRHAIRTDLPVSDGDYVVQDIPRDAQVVVRGAQALLSEEAKSQLGVQAPGGDND